MRGGLGSFQLARAEAAAQEALLSGGIVSASLFVGVAWRCGAGILACVSRGVASPAARALARQDLVTPLLQVAPHDCLVCFDVYSACRESLTSGGGCIIHSCRLRAWATFLQCQTLIMCNSQQLLS
jgi:hypothetical protein